MAYQGAAPAGRIAGRGGARVLTCASRPPLPLRHVVALAALLSACSPPVLQPPRTVVLVSGGRLQADGERLDQIHAWVLALLETITCRNVTAWEGVGLLGWDAPPDAVRREVRTSYCLHESASVSPVPGPASGRTAFRRQLQDPTIHVETLPASSDPYPWETLVAQGDTARVQVARAHPHLRTAHTVYAYLHLMHRQGRLERWLPEAAGAEGYELERAIVERVADTWLLGRSAFFLDPHRPMDALLYAREAGHLDAFLLTLRAGEFPEARARWVAEDPGAPEAYLAWFRSALDGEPPGWGESP